MWPFNFRERDCWEKFLISLIKMLEEFGEIAGYNC